MPGHQGVLPIYHRRFPLLATYCSSCVSFTPLSRSVCVVESSMTVFIRASSVEYAAYCSSESPVVNETPLCRNFPDAVAIAILSGYSEHGEVYVVWQAHSTVKRKEVSGLLVLPDAPAASCKSDSRCRTYACLHCSLQWATVRTRFAPNVVCMYGSVCKCQSNCSYLNNPHRHDVAAGQDHAAT